MEVLVYPDKSALAEAAAQAITEVISRTERNRVTIGFAGGSTPAETYRRLRGLAADWGRVDAWMSDERWVPPDHADSNGRMTAQALLDHVDAAFYRPRWGSWLTAADSAAHYEASLRSLLPDGQADLILLGLGDDGHTASLFPGTSALTRTDRWFVANPVPKLEVDRLTVTYPLLHHARQVLFLTAGEPKAEALRAVLEPDDPSQPLPASRVMEGNAEVTWMVDQAAASRLQSTPTIDG